jgi:hypothetical protein
MVRTSLAALVVALLTVGAMGPAAASGADVRRCGDYVARNDQYRDLRANHTSCRRARSLVRAWANKEAGHGGWITFAKPADWRCRLVTSASGQIVRCESTRAFARVRFRPGHGP